MTIKRVVLPPRRAAYTTYAGPKNALGPGTKLIYSWVGTYFQDRVGDIYVAFARLPKPTDMPQTHIEAEVRFELDDDFDEAARLPEGVFIKNLPSETLIYGTYEGPATGIRRWAGLWTQTAAAKHPVKTGFRQRMINVGKRPSSPDWEIEISLVCA